MDHALMAMAEQYTAYQGSSASNPQPNEAGIQFLKDYVLQTTDYPDMELMEFWGVADMTAVEQAEYALTAPLTDTERNPAPLTYKDTMMGISEPDGSWLEYIEISARSYAEAQQKFNKVAMMNDPSVSEFSNVDLTQVGTNSGFGFYGNFGDGLALVAPTRELVNEMLAGSERSGTLIGSKADGYYSNENDVIGWMKYQGGQITPKTVAINAVMAGAKPEHFPVVLAAMELLSSMFDYDKMFYHGMTTGSDNSWHILLNGPLARELGVTGDIGSFGGAGNEVNNVIGRAIRMCFRNIGHMTREMDDHQYKGREHDFSMIVFREQEEFLPGWNEGEGWDGNARPLDKWVPHHVYMGYKPEESTITLIAGWQTGGSAVTGIGTAVSTTYPTAYWTGRSSATGTATSAGVDIVTMPPGMAAQMYETHGIRSKSTYISGTSSALTTATANNWIQVVAGGDLTSPRRFGDQYNFYGRQNHQIQLISGATMTTNGRAASSVADDSLEHVAVRGRTTDTAAFLNPATTSVAEGAHMPSAVRNVQVNYSAASNGDPTKRNATVTWVEPEDDGNSPIVAYQLALSHAGIQQFYSVTDTPSGRVNLAMRPTELLYPTSGYNAEMPMPTGGPTDIVGTLVSGANRIYSIDKTTDAFTNKSFVFENIPIGYETFVRVRAINNVRNAVDHDGVEISGIGRVHTDMTANLSIRSSGRGAWGQEDGGRGRLVPGNAVFVNMVAPIAGVAPIGYGSALDQETIIGPLTWSPAVTDTFDFETAYTVTFDVKAKLGSTVFDDAFAVSVNGASVSASNIEGTGDTRTVSYTFPKTNKSTGSIELSMLAPNTGLLNNAAARTMTVDSGNVSVHIQSANSYYDAPVFYTIIAVSPWTPEVAHNTGRFVTNTEYSFTFVLIPDEGYSFPEDLDVKVNGIQAQVIPAPGANRRVIVTFPATDPPIEVTSASFSISAPVAGGTNNAAARAITGTNTGITASITNTPWTPAVANNAAFAANTAYTVTITLAPATGYAFPASLSNLNVLINGEPATVTGVAGTGGANRTVTFTFPPTGTLP